MGQASVLYSIPADPRPSKAELEAILHSHDTVYLDEYVARWIAAALWRAHREKADPDAFLVTSAAEVRVFPDGHLTFESYLQSDRWKDIRRRVMARADHLCECCGAWASEIHIRDYRPRVLRGDDLLPVVAICARCLDFIHEDPLTHRERAHHAEKEQALGQIHGQQRRLGQKRSTTGMAQAGQSGQPHTGRSGSLPEAYLLLRGVGTSRTA